MVKYKKSFILLENVDSTNDWARANLSSFCSKSFTIVQSIQQNRGKGISGPWHSPAHVGMYCSYVTFERSNVDSSFIAYMASISVLQILDEIGIRAQVKWPNDILISRRKVGGVLCETVSQGEKVAIIIGVGLNINTEQKDLDKIDQPATSLLLECGSTHCPREIADRLSNRLVANCEIYFQYGFVPFHSFLQSRLEYVGESIQVTTSTQSIFGNLLGIASNGALQLQIATGEIILLYSGKLTVLSDGFL